MRVAIAGLGPKGLFALERLLDRIARAGSAATVEIDVFEPHPVPGAGPVYDPGQPAWLRMNFSDEQIGERYIAWRDASGPGEQAGGYSARADVGRHLAASLRTLLAHTPPGVRVTVVPHRVDGLEREDGGWRVVAAGAAGTYDEVLLAIGHARSWDGALARKWTHAVPLIDGVFPVERIAVAAGATVAVRGFALTFLDAALALSEGRGGRFAPTAHPYRLRYVPGDAGAAALIPFSRSGRPLLAKPQAHVAAGVPGLDAIATAGRERLAAGAGLLDVLAGVAEASLRAAGSPAPAPAGITAWLMAGRIPSAGETAREELARSLDVATGSRAPGLAWALGHAWRAIYPAIVARFSHGGMTVAAWPAFRRLAIEMERVAFGPPVATAARQLALVEAGRIDLRFAAGGTLVSADGRTWVCRGGERRAVDAVIDAVLPPPGAVRDRGPARQWSPGAPDT